MTRERRLAIQMWEEICANPHSHINAIKERFCEEHSLDWKHGCWFCQYVRKDYRVHLKSRHDIDPAINACEACPLYKWFASRNLVSQNFCGCTIDADTLFKRADTLYKRTEEGDVVEEARGLILKALKGEQI